MNQKFLEIKYINGAARIVPVFFARTNLYLQLIQRWTSEEASLGFNREVNFISDLYHTY